MFDILHRYRQSGDATPDPVPAEPVRLHPGIAEAYRRLAEDLHLAIEGDAGEVLRQELRQLIERVDFIPLDGLGKFDLRVHGSLAVLLGLGGVQSAENPTAGDRGVSSDQILTAGRCEVSLGAGVGFEPTTFRL